MPEYKVIVPDNLDAHLQIYVDNKNRPDPTGLPQTPITKDQAVTNQVISWLQVMETDAKRAEAQSVGVDYNSLSEADQAEVRALIESKK